VNRPRPLDQVELSAVSVFRNECCLVSNLTATVPRGSFVAIVGPSGVGKSSFLACLSGMLRPGSGSIAYRCGEGGFSPMQFQSRLGVVFQHLRLVANATVMVNVLCGGLGRHPWWRTLFGFSAADKSDAGEILSRLELDPFSATRVGKISGGERQRVAIARAMMQDPEVILADEPVSSLDHRLARLVLGEFRRECRSHGRTVFCVLHDPALVEEFADSVLTLLDGDWNWRAA